MNHDNEDKRWKIAVSRHDELEEKRMALTAKINHVEQEINRYHKTIDKLEKSRTWKFSAPFRKTISNKHHDEQSIEKLKADQMVMKEELEQLKRWVQKDKHDVKALVKRAHFQGEMIPFLQHFLSQKVINETYDRAIIKEIADRYKNEKQEERNVVYKKLLSVLTPFEIPEVIVRKAEIDDEISLTKGASFRTSLSMRAMERERVTTLPEYVLDDKAIAYQFIEKLGVRKPQVSDIVYTVINLPLKDGVVVKPKDGAGSRGVYLIYQEDHILDVKRSVVWKSFDELKRQMKQDLESDWVKTDEWVIEELIFENKAEQLPARDIKFYCFYGQVGLILEIIRSPELKYCWWNSSGERIRTGKYENELFHGEGVTAKELQLAASISEEVPAPFIRIDFLRGEDGLIFGEFTPKPGNYDEFDRATDQILGEYFVDANARLQVDLLNQKAFQAYKSCNEGMNKEYRL